MRHAHLTRAVFCALVLVPAYSQAQIYVAPDGGSVMHIARVSVKFVLDAEGRRPATGEYRTNEQIEETFNQMNQALANMGADWRLQIHNVVDVPGISQWYGPWTCEDKHEMESHAEADPALFHWSDDAINIYVVNDLANCGGYCSYPLGNADIIVINNSDGILNGSMGWLHEICHYFGVYHTFQCIEPDCPEWNRDCTGAGGTTTHCPDVCPDATNLMSANGFITPLNAVLSPCQMEIIAANMQADGGSRRHVMSHVQSAPPADDGCLDTGLDGPATPTAQSEDTVRHPLARFGGWLSPRERDDRRGAGRHDDEQDDRWHEDLSAAAPSGDSTLANPTMDGGQCDLSLADVTRPRVLLIDFMRADDGVESEAIYVIFSESIDVAAVREQIDFEIADETGPLTGNVSWTYTGRQLTWTPHRPLQPGSHRIRLLTGVPNGFADVAGNPLDINNTGGWFEVSFEVTQADAYGATAVGTCGAGAPFAAVTLLITAACPIARRRRR